MGHIDMRKLHMSLEDLAHIVNEVPELSRALGPYPHARRFEEQDLTDPFWGGLNGWRLLGGPPPGLIFSLLDTQRYGYDNENRNFELMQDDGKDEALLEDPAAECDPDMLLRNCVEGADDNDVDKFAIVCRWARKPEHINSDDVSSILPRSWRRFVHLTVPNRSSKRRSQSIDPTSCSAIARRV
jgi:hypothetical protein